MRFTDIIGPGMAKDSPIKENGGVSIPMAVTSGQQYTTLHGLGKVPRGIFVGMSDQYVSVKVIWRDANHCLVTFNADANLVLRVE
jgi:hypothetical protein